MSEQSLPSNPTDTPETIQKTGNGTDVWIQHSLNQLHAQMNSIDERFNARFDKLDEQLRPIERRINYAIGGIVVAVTVVSILGWILRPFLGAIAAKMLSGG